MDVSASLPESDFRQALANSIQAVFREEFGVDAGAYCAVYAWVAQRVLKEFLTGVKK